MPRSEAMIKAQKKYYNKIISDPILKEQYFNKNKVYYKRYRDKIKDTDDFKIKNRENAKKYYYEHHEEIKEKNKMYYHTKKNKVINPLS
jgi:hypothetical protein